MADNIGQLLTADRPRLVSGDEASYGPGTIRLPEDAVINISGRSAREQQRVLPVATGANQLLPLPL
jgi:hypothetical protein